MIGQAFNERSDRLERGVERVQEPVIPKNIVTEMNDLRDFVTQAHELFSVLEDRTRPVRFPTPQCVKDDKALCGGGSELRGALADQNDRLRVLVCRIATMIDEIDL